jgi:hypothetical protein
VSAPPVYDERDRAYADTPFDICETARASPNPSVGKMNESEKIVRYLRGAAVSRKSKSFQLFKSRVPQPTAAFAATIREILRHKCRNAGKSSTKTEGYRHWRL